MNRNIVEYKGFIATGHDSFLVWKGSNDDKALLEAERGRVQLVSTVDDLLARLRKKHPDEDEQYGYVYADGYGSAEQRSKPVFYADLKNGYWNIAERDYRLLERLARKYGQVTVGNSGILSGQINKTLQFGLDFVVIGDRLIYNPKEAARRRKKKHEALVSNCELAQTTWNFYDALFRHDRSDLWPVCGIVKTGSTSTLNGCAHNFLGFWKLCVQFHGIRKTRNTEAVKELLARWKISREGNDKKWTDAGPYGADMVKLIGELIDGRKRKEVVLENQKECPV